MNNLEKLMKVIVTFCTRKQGMDFHNEVFDFDFQGFGKGSIVINKECGAYTCKQLLHGMLEYNLLDGKFVFGDDESVYWDMARLWADINAGFEADFLSLLSNTN